MRVLTVVSAAILLSGAAWAQDAPVLDGKATLSGLTRDMLSYSAQPLSKEAVRGLISVYINKPAGERQTQEEKDFFAELASGGAVEVITPRKPVTIEPLGPEALHSVKMLLSPPNLNSLWKRAGPPAEDMLEFARWGERGRSRIVQFMGNTLYGAWKKSAVTSAYKTWIEEWQAVNHAFEGTVQGEDLTHAKLLLKDAMIELFAKCKADGRVPPPKFLYDLQLASVGSPMP